MNTPKLTDPKLEGLAHDKTQRLSRKPRSLVHEAEDGSCAGRAQGRLRTRQHCCRRRRRRRGKPAGSCGRRRASSHPRPRGSARGRRRAMWCRTRCTSAAATPPSRPSWVPSAAPWSPDPSSRCPFSPHCLIPRKCTRCISWHTGHHFVVTERHTAITCSF